MGGMSLTGLPCQFILIAILLLISHINGALFFKTIASRHQTHRVQDGEVPAALSPPVLSPPP